MSTYDNPGGGATHVTSPNDSTSCTPQPKARFSAFRKFGRSMINIVVSLLLAAIAAYHVRALHEIGVRTGAEGMTRFAAGAQPFVWIVMSLLAEMLPEERRPDLTAFAARATLKPTSTSPTKPKSSDAG